MKARQSNPLNMAIIALFFTLASVPAGAQAVTEVITTYGGYWKSSSTSVSTIKPDTSHTLLAFKYNNVRYSTGVNNAALAIRGDFFYPADFRSLSIAGMSGAPNSNTKVGLGEKYDGVTNGPSNPPPSNNLFSYLTDGINGLNIGTGVANLPSGTINFSVNSLRPSAINDGVPDILVTQIADPSGAQDQYEFLDANGVRVGNLVTINFNSLTPVGNWTADFYEATSNPMTLTPGFTKTDRALRLWAADFADFGITRGMANRIARFVIHLNGNSDVAFVAYNYSTAVILPVKYSFFQTAVSGKDVVVNWQTVTEINNRDFTVETSTDGEHFTALTTIEGAGNSTAVNNYSYRHINPGGGNHFYRIKQTDQDGKYDYTAIRKETIIRTVSVGVYPNPTSAQAIVTHPAAKIGDRVTLYSLGGQIMIEKAAVIGTTQTTLNVSTLPKGTYVMNWKNGNGEVESRKISVI